MGMLGRKHSQQSKDLMSRVKCRHTTEEVLKAYRENDYNAEKATRAMGEIYGYVQSHLKNLYRRNPAMKEKLQAERLHFKSTKEKLFPK